MGSTTVPAKTTYICDRCKKTSDDASFLSVKIDLPGRDYSGGIVGPGGTFDLCQSCGENVLPDFLRGKAIPALEKE